MCDGEGRLSVGVKRVQGWSERICQDLCFLCFVVGNADLWFVMSRLIQISGTQTTQLSKQVRSDGVC